MEGVEKWRGRRVMVTGGTGFIGRHVLVQGIKSGVELVSVGRQSPMIPQVEHVRADIRDGARLRDIVKTIRPEGVLHLAAAGVTFGSETFADLLQVNVIGTESLLSAVVDTRIQIPVVMGGTVYEYAPQDRPICETDPVAPYSAYAATKAAATLCAAIYAKQLPVTVLRLFNTYGPGDRPPRLVPYVIDAARTGDAIQLTSGAQLRDYVYVEDAAEAFWRTLTAQPPAGALRPLNVGTGTPITLREFVESLAHALQEQGLHPKLEFGAKPYRADEPMMCTADVSRLRDALGWVPSTDVTVGLRKTVESML